MAFQSNLPKGCPNLPYRPARTSGNTWSSELTKRSSSKYNAWLYYDIHPKPSGVTGKHFTLDLVFTYDNASFFNWPATYVDIAFQFYSIVTQSWTGYYHYNQWCISNSHPDPENLWDRYYNYGSYRPAWGIFSTSVKVPGITVSASGPSYDEYAAAASAAGMSTPRWDATNIYSYAYWIPWGMRYLSNGTHAQPGRTYPDASPFIRSHGQTSRGLTYGGLDRGGTTSGLKDIDLSADWIRSRVGTLTGITNFRMRVRMGWDPLDSKSFCTWTFGGNQPGVDPEDSFTTIDNPLIGLLDYGPRGPKETDWPPRFDAQAWYRNRGGTPVKLQAQYKPRGGNWNIF